MWGFRISLKPWYKVVAKQSRVDRAEWIHHQEKDEVEINLRGSALPVYADKLDPPYMAGA
jgi:hypothetical protein